MIGIHQKIDEGFYLTRPKDFRKDALQASGWIRPIRGTPRLWTHPKADAVFNLVSQENHGDYHKTVTLMQKLYDLFGFVDERNPRDL